MKAFVCIILFLIGIAVQAQPVQDTTQTQVQPEAVRKPLPAKWKIIGGFDARRSFFSGRPVKISGIRLGAELWGKDRFGVGVYALSRSEVFRDLEVNQPDATDTSLVQFRVGFGALFYERVLYRSKRWFLSVPLYYGGGTLEGDYTDTAGVYKPLVREPFNTLGFGFNAQFKIWRWLAPGVGVGYRSVFNTIEPVKTGFSRTILCVQIVYLIRGIISHGV